MNFKLCSPLQRHVMDSFDKWMKLYEDGHITRTEFLGNASDYALLLRGLQRNHALVKVKIIVAYDEDYGIGNENKIPWRIKEDMAHFKETTMGSPVIMGRKTWESIPAKFRPLPGRYNIILSRTGVNTEGLEETACCKSLEEALDLARAVAFNNTDTVFITGGGEIYDMALEKNLVDEIIATEVKDVHPCDTFFQHLYHEDSARKQWNRTVILKHELFNVVRYERREQ